MCTVNRKTEQEDRMTRRLRGKCFFVAVSNGKWGGKSNRRGKRAEDWCGAKNICVSVRWKVKSMKDKAGEKQSGAEAEGERKMRVGKNSRKDERGRRNVRIMPAAVEKMRPQRKRKTEVPGKQ